MDTDIDNWLKTLSFHQSLMYGKMDVIPLFSTQNVGPEYHTLTEALSKDLITITELSAEGSVPQLKVATRGATPVLLIDGEEISGAKQNRVLNTTILVPGNSGILIPVSCTEQGRWSYATREFYDSDVMMASKIRTKKMASVSDSLKDYAEYRSDQSEIWDEIDSMARKARIRSPTGAMKDIFTTHEKKMKKYIDAFPLQEGQQGVMIYLNDKPAGIEFLSRPEAYARIHAKLIQSYVLEALINDKGASLPPEMWEQPSDFLHRIHSCTTAPYPSLGLGTEHRLEGSDLVGSALLHDDVVIHFACFANDEDEDRHRDERMASARNRRRAQTRRAENPRTEQQGRSPQHDQ